jgi:hypothetical protein
MCLIATLGFVLDDPRKSVIAEQSSVVGKEGHYPLSDIFFAHPDA